MRLEEICSFLNEIGILDLKHTQNFLSIYTNFLLNNKNLNRNKNIHDIDNNTLKIILFAYIKNISSDDKELYDISSNIINSYNKNKLIKQYQAICFLKKIIFFHIKNRFNHFLFLLFKKKYPKRKYFPYKPSVQKLPFKNQNLSYDAMVENLTKLKIVLLQDGEKMMI